MHVAGSGYISKLITWKLELERTSEADDGM
jgi:hypothetical protein